MQLRTITIDDTEANVLSFASLEDRSQFMKNDFYDACSQNETVHFDVDNNMFTVEVDIPETEIQVDVYITFKDVILEGTQTFDLFYEAWEFIRGFTDQAKKVFIADCNGGTVWYGPTSDEGPKLSVWDRLSTMVIKYTNHLIIVRTSFK